MDFTLHDIFGIAGQVIGGLILYICCVNYALKGLKLLFSQGIIDGFFIRLFALCYGIIITPLLLITAILVALAYPFCMIYQHLIVPGLALFWTYIDVLIEYTSILPDLLETGFMFVIARLTAIQARRDQAI